MKSKKLLAAALAAVLTLAGCGTTVLSAEETKELLTLSQKTMATVESMAAEMTIDRKSTRLNSSHKVQSRMPSSA